MFNINNIFKYYSVRIPVMGWILVFIVSRRPNFNDSREGNLTLKTTRKFISKNGTETSFLVYSIVSFYLLSIHYLSIIFLSFVYTNDLESIIALH